MFGITPKTQITIGLTMVLLSIMMGASFLGLIPDDRLTALDGRRKLCEALAINSSVLVGRKHFRELEAILQATVQRNDDMLSAGVRDKSGNLVIEVGPHATHWLEVPEERSIDTQLQVPLSKDGEKWGAVELRFESVQKESGLAGFWQDPSTKLMIFVGCSSFLFFLMYLRKMLSALDPSKAVPKRVRHALDSLAEGLIVIDPDGRILLANQAFSNWVDQDASKMTGKNIAKLPWEKSEVGSDEFPWDKAIRDQALVTGQFMELTDKEGDRRTLNANVSPLIGQGGQSRGVMISFDDVTQLEQTKRDLKVAMQIAENANEAKSDFLARMSHEIRTPMNAILGFSDVLRQGFEGDDSERQEHLNTIHSSGQHLLNLINDILDLSKVEAGKLEIESKPCSPYQVVREVARVLRVKADEKNISLNVQCDGRLPETIFSDAVRLRQIITNLVGNAIKFTEQGGVRIDLRLGENEKLHIDIADSGIGMSKQALEKIFDPFSQADTSITRRFGGTGLGLSISKKFAEALGGDIEVESVSGRGSVFRVTIATGSLDDIPLVDGRTLESQTVAHKKDSVSDYWLHSCQVLVADDSVANRKLLNLYLGRAGARVSQAEDGEMAVQMATNRDYDIILMDMQMPIMDGYTATETLRERGNNVPIVALTADAMKGAEDRCYAAGCNGFLTKPIEMDRLIAAIVELLPIEGDDQFAASVDESNVTEDPVEEPVGMDLDFDEIRGEFIELLERKLTDLESAVAAHDLDQIELIAHSIRGGGATFGFHSLTDPALEVELLAQQNDLASLSDAVAELVEIGRPIVETATEVESKNSSDDVFQVEESDNCEPIVSSLPTDDPEFAEIVVEFVGTLHEKLDEMDSVWQAGELDQLAKLAHWLKGAGGMTGFDAFTSPSRQLEILAKEEKPEQIPQAIQLLRSLTDRIVLPTMTGSVS